MDTTNMILTESVSPPALLSGANPGSGPSEEKKVNAAKEFESILIGRLLDEMRNTIGDWGTEKDATSKQVHGLFWLFLANDIASKGGFGMWKDMCRFYSDSGGGDAGLDSSG